MRQQKSSNTLRHLLSCKILYNHRDGNTLLEIAITISWRWWAINQKSWHLLNWYCFSTKGSICLYINYVLSSYCFTSSSKNFCQYIVMETEYEMSSRPIYTGKKLEEHLRNSSLWDLDIYYLCLFFLVTRTNRAKLQTFSM